MWIPTHVKVTVHKARNLTLKGRSGANDSYVVIHHNDLRFTTSVKTRNKSPEWNENYDMPIPSDLQNSVIKITVHNRNFLSLDDFLGETHIMLKQMNVYERPQSRWYKLSTKLASKRTSDDTSSDNNLGEVQVTLTFMVQSTTKSSDVSKAKFERQRSLSFKSLANLVGTKLTSRWSSHTDLRDSPSPLAELTERRFTLHSMVEIHDVSRSFHRMRLRSSDDDLFNGRQEKRPGSMEFHFEEQVNSENSLTERNVGKEQDIQLTPVSAAVSTDTIRRRPSRPRSLQCLQTLIEENQEQKSKETLEYINNATNFKRSSSGTPVYAEDFMVRPTPKRHSYNGFGETSPMVATYKLSEIDGFITKDPRIIRPPMGTSSPRDNPQEDCDLFEKYDRDELIKLVLDQQSWMKSKQQYVQDLESYIDGLLIRVLETNHQSILENPYKKPNNKSKTKSEKDEKQKLAGKIKKKQLIDLFKIWKQ